MYLLSERNNMNYLLQIKIEENLEWRVYEMSKGYAAALWDLDSDHNVGMVIFPEEIKALEYAKEMAAK